MFVLKIEIENIFRSSFFSSDQLFYFVSILNENSSRSLVLCCWRLLFFLVSMQFPFLPWNNYFIILLFVDTTERRPQTTIEKNRIQNRESRIEDINISSRWTLLSSNQETMLKEFSLLCKDSCKLAEKALEY